MGELWIPQTALAPEINSQQSQHQTGAPPSGDPKRDYVMEIRDTNDVLRARYFLYNCPVPLLREGEEVQRWTCISGWMVIKPVITEIPQEEEE